MTRKMAMFGRPRAALFAPFHLELPRVSSPKLAVLQPQVGLSLLCQHAAARKVNQTLEASGAPVHRWSTMWMTHLWTPVCLQKSGIDTKCAGGKANMMAVRLSRAGHTYMKFVR